MIPLRSVTRRKVLRGMLGGGAVTVGLPLLDCFLNTNGTALASGEPLPVCFGAWFTGLGFNPGRWEPKIVGAKYEMAAELQSLAPFRDKINIYSGMKAFTDGHPNQPHQTGHEVTLGGGVQIAGNEPPPTIDAIIADAVGSGTRFRSLEVSADGSATSKSRRAGNVLNPSETSPAAFYTRIFGPEFKDPNAAEFVPDPKVMAKRSVLSGVSEHREQFLKTVGTADRSRLDAYFTSLRELEQQLALQLQKPAPLKACSIPGKIEEPTLTSEIEDTLRTNKIFSGLLAHALACGQTRVFNVNFSGAMGPGGSNIRRAGSGATFHIVTHEESLDPKLGYQPTVSWFMTRMAEGFRDTVAALDAIQEGDGTLLDRTVVMLTSDTGFAKFHSLDNLPLVTAGKLNGRIKTGLHIAAPGDPVTRLGLTLQQLFGVHTSSWGTESNQTSKTISEMIA